MSSEKLTGKDSCSQAGDSQSLFSAGTRFMNESTGEWHEIVAIPDYDPTEEGLRWKTYTTSRIPVSDDPLQELIDELRFPRTVTFISRREHLDYILSCCHTYLRESRDEEDE